MSCCHDTFDHVADLHWKIFNIELQIETLDIIWQFISIGSFNLYLDHSIRKAFLQENQICGAEIYRFIV